MKRESKKTAFSITEQILNALQEVAFREGMAEVTIQKVADQADIAFSTVRYHFSSQNKSLESEVIQSILKQSYQFLDEWMFEQRDEEEFDPVQHYAWGMLEWCTRYRKQASLTSYFYYLNTTKIKNTLEISHEKVLERAMMRIEGLVHEGIGRGKYKPDMEIPICARAIQVLLLGAGLNLATTSKKEIAKQTQQSVFDSIRVILKVRDT